MKHAFITKRKDSPFYSLYYYDNGKRKKISTRKTTYNEAREFLQRFIKSPEQYTNPESKQIKFSTFAYDYISEISEVRKLKTIKGYKTAVKYFISEIGDRFLQSYTVNDINSFINTVIRNSSKFSAMKYRVVLNVIFGKAHHRGYIKNNVVEQSNKIKPPKTTIIYFTQDEMKKILKALDKKLWLRDIVLFGLYTGMRLNEIVNFKKESVNLKKKLLYINNDSTFSTKTGEPRTVSIAEELFPTLKRNIELSKCDYLFGSEYWNHRRAYTMDYVSHRFTQVCHKLALRKGLSFHALRRTFATWLINSGVPIAEISQMLGHRSILITQNSYASVINAKYSDSVNKIKI